MWYGSAMLPIVHTVLPDGVWLTLKGAAIANNSYVDVDDIGNNDEDALLCHTNKTACCRFSNAAGNWYFPNDGRVETTIDNMRLNLTSHFSRNRGTRLVRLLRFGAPTERGRFYCQVPDANDEIQTIYVNIGE